MPFLGPVTIVSSCCLLEDVAITVEINLNSRSEIVRRALRSPPGSSSLPRSRRANWPAAGPPSASTGVKSARQRCRAIADPEFVLSPASGTVGPQSENDRTREGRRAPARPDTGTSRSRWQARSNSIKGRQPSHRRSGRRPMYRKILAVGEEQSGRWITRQSLPVGRCQTAAFRQNTGSYFHVTAAELRSAPSVEPL